MNVAEHSLTNCMWVCFHICSHTMPGQQHSQPNNHYNTTKQKKSDSSRDSHSNDFVTGFFYITQARRDCAVLSHTNAALNIKVYVLTNIHCTDYVKKKKKRRDHVIQKEVLWRLLQQKVWIDQSKIRQHHSKLVPHLPIKTVLASPILVCWTWFTPLQMKLKMRPSSSRELSRIRYHVNTHSNSFLTCHIIENVATGKQHGLPSFLGPFLSLCDLSDC